MGTFNGLPLFAAKIEDETCGMYRVSLVDRPAVESNFQSFRDAAKAPQRYAVADEEQQRVFGVLMRANYPIYRKDADGTEYYIVYGRETIRQMMEKYLAENRSSNVNEMHEDGSDVVGVHLVQTFIKDGPKGLDPKGFEEIEDGSLFAEYHVTNNDVWAKIKDGSFRGFSLEGYFVNSPVEKLRSQEKSQKSKIENDMKKEIRDYVRKLVGVKFASVATDKGVLEYDGEEALKVGDAVRIVPEDGSDPMAAEDGDYTLEDGTIATVKDGVVTEIEAPEPEPTEEDNKKKRCAEETGDDTEKRLTALETIVKKMAGWMGVTVINENGEEAFSIADPNEKRFAGLETAVKTLEGTLSKMGAQAQPRASEKPIAEDGKTAVDEKYRKIEDIFKHAGGK